ncbi:hypothetical protein Jinkies_11 [Arthrobacter phage Jinkies]|uniref:Uncharacterized protein n=1 Tax=Arthrobacter phage Jinkies TaxID=2743903 RepID=A0A7S5WX31_9CAUD|nr:hypothetical protein Jinkies_11 [Arthrobacter phage Jinkies]
MARQARATDTGAEVDTTPVEQDVADTTATEAAAAAETVPAADPRESALAALVYGNSTPETVVTPATELVVDNSEVLDFGGRSKAVILFSYYNQLVDGVVRSAKKGQVISTDAESLKRGERIGSLKKYGE